MPDAQGCLHTPRICNIFPRQQWLRKLASVLELVRNLVAHGDARERKWRGNWRMEWVASNLTPPPNVVYPALLKLMRTPRLPAVDWTDAPTDLNGLVRFGERRNLVYARMPSRSARAILSNYVACLYYLLIILPVHLIRFCVTEIIFHDCTFLYSRRICFSHCSN